ncbi:ABC transporter ATP-binding protein [Herpetosiphon giganteus]|uniref:ABC transporter ATP-binding protein n=1 Tax=Herpetosiphon giganteus TaxID=2029754 RepID=UPI0019571C9A|nr:ATP-binding cassette domain-containing protein [Herpetosiphon giganteus]MBM7842318.1 ABC-2 type transport system ATP-binding protein [Herpetosiphon giganteus]
MGQTIKVDTLIKTFQVPEREAGLKAAVGSLFKRKYREVEAVKKISFGIEAGEIVGFLGPNGAGKTTTLKMLAGLLFPTSGQIDVLGYEPQRREKELLRQITIVMGQRNQLMWDIPALDSFELQRAIYQIPEGEFRRMRDELIDLLNMGDLVKKPVRNLSLGERMKAEFISALLHRPKVLFLDEPTIGLDVTAQRLIREFVAAYNQRYQASVMLTSHYMADVQALCKRVIVIHHGQLLYDGGLAGLVEKFAAYKTIGVTLNDPELDLSEYGEIISNSKGQVNLRVPKSATAQITTRLLNEVAISDLTIEDPAIDSIIEQVFQQEAQVV